MTKRKKIVKGIAAVLAAILIAGSGNITKGNGVVKASDVSDSQIEISVPDNKVPTYEYRKAQDFILNIKNNGKEEVQFCDRTCTTKR